MVLARHPQKAVVWGYTDKAGENITGTMYTDPPATVNVMSVSQDGVTGGVWIITFPSQNPLKEGVKIEVKKQGEQSITLSDVLFGDVWICSGQSNMQFTLDMVCCTTDSEESCNNINSTWVDAPITEHNSHSVTLSYGGDCSSKKVVGLRYAWQETPCEFKKCAMYQTENLLPMAPYINMHFNHSSDIHVYNIINRS
ncbi:hypothetical protein FSP39_012142 [Pinctada imbricata]|uniref:Uncharacterized protein n=1 Tax=Pinctada imbricata TaxID=66713 RepID=A0AA88YAI4_PINIB|nr:hypothetical protein FSP39_012142 [Pinctada imbricata]